MAQANSTLSTRAPADSSRRRFLTVAAAASAVSATALAASSAMPVQPTSAFASLDDSALVKLEEQILQHKKAIDAMEPEVERLEDIWDKAERKAIVDNMPEFKECMRLRHLQASEREVADGLVKQMWEIKAQTAEGRRAKVNVLLSFVFDDDEWRQAVKQPGDVYDVILARELLIDLVGGQPGEQLRSQFA